MTESTQPSECKRSLLLLVDNSASINDKNWLKQVQSTANALRRPEIVDVLVRDGGIALAAVSFDEWAQRRVDWQVIRSQGDAEKFADNLASIAGNRKPGGATNIGRALNYSLDEFQRSPCPGSSTIDISTDAESNGDVNPQGFEDMVGAMKLLNEARHRAAMEKVVINGIGVNGTQYQGEVVRKMLVDTVITRDGFAMGTDWKNYSEAIYRKLSVEIAALQGDVEVPAVPRIRLAQGPEK